MDVKLPNRVWLCEQADYIINGNCRNVLHMSPSDQVELWRAVVDGMSACYALCLSYTF